MKYLNSISDKLFNAICWSSLLFEIFMIKKWVEFCLTSFGTLKYDCVIKAIEMFNFLSLIKNYATTGLSLLSLIVSAIIPSITINVLFFLPILYSSIF